MNFLSAHLRVIPEELVTAVFDYTACLERDWRQWLSLGSARVDSIWNPQPPCGLSVSSSSSKLVKILLTSATCLSWTDDLFLLSYLLSTKLRISLLNSGLTSGELLPAFLESSWLVTMTRPSMNGQVLIPSECCASGGESLFCPSAIDYHLALHEWLYGYRSRLPYANQRFGLQGWVKEELLSLPMRRTLTYDRGTGYFWPDIGSISTDLLTKHDDREWRIERIQMGGRQAGKLLRRHKRKSASDVARP